MIFVYLAEELKSRFYCISLKSHSITLKLLSFIYVGYREGILILKWWKPFLVVVFFRAQVSYLNLALYLGNINNWRIWINLRTYTHRTNKEYLRINIFTNIYCHGSLLMSLASRSISMKVETSQMNYVVAPQHYWSHVEGCDEENHASWFVHFSKIFSCNFKPWPCNSIFTLRISLFLLIIMILSICGFSHFYTLVYTFYIYSCSEYF